MSAFVPAMMGNISYVENFISQGGDINLPDYAGNTPMMGVAMGGHISIAELLLNHGADINIQDNKGNTPLMVAVGNKHENIVKLFLQSRKVNVDQADSYGNTALIRAIEFGLTNMVTILLEYGADPNHINNRGHTALMVASASIYTECVRLLILYGANMDYVGIDGTALMFAVSHGRTNNVAALLENGANVDQRDSNGKTALMFASSSERIAKLLLSYGADINAKTDFTGESVLMHIVKYGRLPIVQFFLEQGADINHESNTGDTALTSLYDTYRIDIMKYLILYGATK